jgi:4-amino-4-deoxy-L-arabinose transferase-like glycosyltransferase
MLCHIIVSAVAILIFVTDASNSGLWHPDAPSHALNALFYRDMIQDRGFLDPVRYGERYYVQYPSLTIGMYPPVFYAVEAGLYTAFGVSAAMAKLAVLLFTLLGANAFCLLCRHWFSSWIAGTGSVLFLIQPVTLFGQKDVMLEMPALAISLCSLWCLYRIANNKGTASIRFLAPLVTAMAFLTKQTAAFLLPVWVVWLTLRKRWVLLRSRVFVFSSLLGVTFLVPWVFINLTVGRSYLSAFALEERHFGSNLLYYAGHISEIISYPLAFLCLCSILLFWKLKKNDGYQLAILWSASVLVFICLMGYAAPRYAIFIVPALVILSMYPLQLFVDRFRKRGVWAVLTLALICSHAYPRRAWSSKDVTGFEPAVDFILRDRQCVSVLYDGYFNSNFIFNMRARDRERRVFVFRASKLVFSTRMIVDLGYRDLIKHPEAFYDALNRNAIKYIVEESKDSLKTAANVRLRQWVQGEKFKLVDEYPLTGHGLGSLGKLLVYEYLDYKPKAIREIELDMPMLGRKMKVKIDGHLKTPQ